MEMKKFILPLLGALGLVTTAIAYADMFPINKDKGMVKRSIFRPLMTRPPWVASARRSAEGHASKK